MYRLFLAIIIIVLFSCGSESAKDNTEKVDDSLIEVSYTCADFASMNGYKIQSAIIIDFVNVSDNLEFNFLETQIPDNLFRNINRCFSLVDNGRVRDYIIENSISSEELRNKERVKEIGIHFGVDLVIFGTFTIISNEIQIIGEIFSTQETGAYNDFKLTCKKDELLSKLDILSNTASQIAVSTFPPKKINENLVIKEASNINSIAKVVYNYQNNKEISYKSKPKDNSNTLEEIPSPRPKWTYEVPVSDDYLYFIGQAMEQNDFNTGLTTAIQDAYLSMSRAVGKNIKSSYTKTTTSSNEGYYSEITGKLIVKTLNYVRGDKLEAKYYRKLKNNKYEICVLFKLSKIDLEKNIAESIKLEAKRLEEANQIAEANKAKMDALKYQKQLELLETIKQREEELKKIAQEKPKYIYTKSEEKHQEYNINEENNKIKDIPKKKLISKQGAKYRKLIFNR